LFWVANVWFFCVTDCHIINNMNDRQKPAKFFFIVIKKLYV
jgi:hypothetical protein